MENFIVTNVHSFPDGTSHTSQTNAELVCELLANGSYPTVAQVVDIINISLRVDKLNQVLYDGNDVFLSKYAGSIRYIKSQLLVDSVTANITEVVSLVGEEQLVDNVACCCLVRWLCISELAVYIENCLLFGVAGIFLQSIVDDCVVGNLLILLVEEDSLYTSFHNLINVLIFDNGLAVENDLVSFERYNFCGIFVNKVLNPSLQHSCGKASSNDLLQSGLGNLYFVCQIKDFKNILIVFETNSPQQSCYRQFLLSVDISIHHCINIGSKFYPSALERDNSCRIQFGTVGMHRLAEEYAWRPVQL